MKGLGFGILIGLLLLLIMGRPQSKLQPSLEARQAQEEIEAEVQSLKVVQKATNEEEESILDIIWLKKAAKVAIAQGTPYFNVLEKYVNEENKYSIMEGTIELVKDPMEAEYDGHAIIELTLSTDISR